jgi:protein involved in polysaccharide export with SLBB domain
METGIALPGYLVDAGRDNKSEQGDAYSEENEIRIKASKRHIILKRRDGSELRVDLLKYERTGSLDDNPKVLDGDVITVPVVQTDINKCGIFGAVKAPGFLEYFEGDRISDLIMLAHGLTLNALLTEGHLVRFGDDKVSTTTIDINIPTIMSNPGGTADYLLLPDDRVFIKEVEPFHEKKQVHVDGEVYYPGTYWIESDTVMLSEILKRAGGPTEDANLYQAEMIRKSMESISDPEFERLKKMQVSDMDETEYEYFKMRSREIPGRVALNLHNLLVLGDSTYDVPLRKGDSLFIPKRSLTVSVTGQVANPGLIPFKDGANVEYYILKAGGFTDDARESKIRIIKESTGEWIKPDKYGSLKPGDTIWVPEKPDIHYWQIIKDGLIFTGNLATIYLVIRQATRD